MEKKWISRGRRMGQKQRRKHLEKVKKQRSYLAPLLGSMVQAWTWQAGRYFYLDVRWEFIFKVDGTTFCNRKMSLSDQNETPCITHKPRKPRGLIKISLISVEWSSRQRLGKLLIVPHSLLLNKCYSYAVWQW